MKDKYEVSVDLWKRLEPLAVELGVAYEVSWADEAEGVVYVLMDAADWEMVYVELFHDNLAIIRRLDRMDKKLDINGADLTEIYAMLKRAEGVNAKD